MPTETINGADLYYETTGDGPAIVFLHGVLMSSRFLASSSHSATRIS